MLNVQLLPQTENPQKIITRQHYFAKLYDDISQILVLQKKALLTLEFI